MVKRAVVAYFGRLADDDTHAVVDKEAPPDLRSGMDLDPGQEAPAVRNQPREPLESHAPKPMCEAVHEQRVKPRVAGNDLPGVARGRIALEYDGYLFPNSR